MLGHLVTARASDSMFLFIDFVHVTNCFLRLRLRYVNCKIIIGNKVCRCLMSLATNVLAMILGCYHHHRRHLVARKTQTYKIQSI